MLLVLVDEAGSKAPASSRKTLKGRGLQPLTSPPNFYPLTPALNANAAMTKMPAMMAKGAR